MVDFKSFQKSPTKFGTLLIGLMTLVLSMTALIWSFMYEKILAYGDAEAHLNIAKRVTDSLTPGFSQLGGVWLPLPHILMLPFVWNDFLWRTGLAGSIVSIVSLLWTTFILYKLGYLVSKNYLASFIAPLVFLVNPNVLYLSTTPMSEILLSATLVSSMYFFIKWVYDEKYSTLILAAFFAFFATLSRYDGWFLVILELIGIIFFSLVKKCSFKKIEGGLVIFGTLAFLGIALWLLWNWLIFGNMFYFANSDYGSKAQQMWFYDRGYLPTYKNLPLSFLYYITDSYLIIGTFVFIASVVSFAYFILNNLSSWIRLRKIESFSLLILLLPLAFYTVSLFTGQASQILPPFSKENYEWNLSNVRYGVHMLIPAGIFMTYLAKKNKFISIAFLVIVAIQFSLFLIKGNVIAYQDGVEGLSSQRISKGPDAPIVEKWVRENYDGGLVIMDDYRRPISPVSSGVTMNNFISVGNKPYWDESLINPSKYADWIILQKADTDAFWKNLKNKERLNRNFTLAFKSGNIYVYKRKEIVSKFLHTEDNKIFFNNKEVVLRGLNIYDLMQDDESQIQETLNNLQSKKINSIRIWAFNKEGTINNDDFSRLDFILNKSRQKNIFVILVLGNQWSDYGGKNAFSVSEKDFFTSEKSRDLYKKHIKKLLSRTNSIDNIKYTDDVAIAGWELLNEPRVENVNDSREISEWTMNIGKFIKENDKNHLISIGTEGFLGGNSKRAYFENHGSRLQDICGLDIVDICSVHLFPKYLKNPTSNSELELLIKEWKKTSDILDKPIYIGEVGFDLNAVKKDKFNERRQFFDSLFTLVNKYQFNGVLIWNLAKEHNNFYSLSFDNSNDAEIIDNLKKITYPNQN